MKTLVKICGLTSAADARAAAEAGAFALGFNFHPASPRFVEPARVAEIAAGLPPRVLRVGVFVDRARSEVEDIARIASLTGLQFHGAEPPEYCRGWGLPVIKAVRVRSRADAASLATYPVEFTLVDAYVEGVLGGTGTRLDWRLLETIDRSRLILAGGLTPENVAEAVRTVRPFAVDVASGVESSPGVKDHEKVKRFIHHAETA